MNLIGLQLALVTKIELEQPITPLFQNKVASELVEKTKHLTRIENEIEQLTELLATYVVTFPNCRKFQMSHNYFAPTPPGYQSHYTQDLMWSKKGEHFDDFRLFTSINKALPGEPAKCYVNHLISGRELYGASSKRTFFGSEKFILPKGSRGHLRSSPKYFCGSLLYLTVIEEKTDKTIYQEYPLPPDTEIDLPFSSTKEQIFKIKIKKTWHNDQDPYLLCYYPHSNQKLTDDARGAIVFYIDHLSLAVEEKEKTQQKIDTLQAEYEQLLAEIELGE